MTASDATPAAPEGGKGGEAATQVVASHAKHSAPTPADHEGAPAASARDFASLLAGADAGTAVPPNTPPAVPQEVTEPATTDTTGLPDQLLALLDNSWMKSPAADSARTPAAATAAPSAWATANAASGATMRGASTANRDPAAALAGIALPQQAAASSTMDTGASAARVADMATTAATADASPAPGFPALTPTVANATIERAIAAPVSVPANPEAGFDDGFGARLVWMAEQRLGHAEIRLNPEHLGPIDVRVQVDGTQVSAEFHSGHAVVRQAIEASLPRLRELLEQQGMQLGQADVGQRHAGSGQPGRERAEGRSEAGSPANANPGIATRSLRSRGLLDEYA